VQSLAQFPLNYASRRRRGLDVQVNYNHALSSDTRLSVRGYYTHQFSNSNYIDPARPTLETRVLRQLGDPKNEVVFNADLTIKQVTLGYGAHYIGPMLTTPYANLYGINGNPPQNADIVNITKYPSVLYHDLRVSVQIGATTATRKGFEWFVGVHNVADKHPPLGSTATGAGSAIYDVLGRSFFSGVRATF
jgi:hypothetical protein